MTKTHRPLLGSVPRALAFAAALLLLLTLAPLSGASAQTPPASFEGDVEIEIGDGAVPARRFAGNDRIETSGLIATDDTTQNPFDPAAFSGDSVILARSELEFDALAGSVLGGLEDAPIVLTPPDTDADGGMLNEDTLATLEEFDDLQEIFLLGQEAAIGEDIESELATEFPDADITRIGGVNRFETAALISERITASDDVIIARADDAADALVSGAIAAAAEIPILLTGRSGPLDEFAAAELERLDPDRVLIAGGVMAIAQDTEDDIESITPGAEIERVAGNNAFSTAVRFAQLADDEFGFGTDHINLARRDLAFDALALGPHAALDVGGPAPIVLTGPDDLPDETEEYFTGEDVTDAEDLGDEGIADCLFESLDIAGGIAAVSEDVEDESRELLSGAEGDACNIELTPESATNLVGESHTVTAFVTDNAGDPSDAGSTVTFDVESDETGTAGAESSTVIFLSETEVATSETGTAQFTFTSTQPGSFTVTASVTDSEGNVETATATKNFVFPDGFFSLDGGTAVEGQVGVIDPALFGIDSDDMLTIEGVNEGTTLVGLDVRPSTGQLYGLGDDGELYKIDQEDDGTVVATSVGNLNDLAQNGDFDFSGNVGFDFNPSGPVALRIVLDDSTNLRVAFNPQGNPMTVNVDAPLSLDGESATAITAVAYTNNPDFGSGETATATQLYYIDTEQDLLLEAVGNPNAGVLEVVGELGIDVESVTGYDIVVSPSGQQIGYAAFTVDGEIGLYSVNTETGETLFLEELPASDGLAIGAFVNDQDNN